MASRGKLCPSYTPFTNNIIWIFCISLVSNFKLCYHYVYTKWTPEISNQCNTYLPMGWPKVNITHSNIVISPSFDSPCGCPGDHIIRFLVTRGTENVWQKGQPEKAGLGIINISMFCTLWGTFTINLESKCWECLPTLKFKYTFMCRFPLWDIRYCFLQ